jgi:hypothetical protein
MNNAVNAENAVKPPNVNNVCRIALNMAGTYAIQPPLSVKIMRKILWFLKRIGYRLAHEMPGSFPDSAPSFETPGGWVGQARQASSDEPAFSALTALPL